MRPEARNQQYSETPDSKAMSETQDSGLQHGQGDQSLPPELQWSDALSSDRMDGQRQHPPVLLPHPREPTGPADAYQGADSYAAFQGASGGLGGAAPYYGFYSTSMGQPYQMMPYAGQAQGPYAADMQGGPGPMGHPAMHPMSDPHMAAAAAAGGVPGQHMPHPHQHPHAGGYPGPMSPYGIPEGYPDMDWNRQSPQGGYQFQGPMSANQDGRRGPLLKPMPPQKGHQSQRHPRDRRRGAGRDSGYDRGHMRSRAANRPDNSTNSFSGRWVERDDSDEDAAADQAGRRAAAPHPAASRRGGYNGARGRSERVHVRTKQDTLTSYEKSKLRMSPKDKGANKVQVQKTKAAAPESEQETVETAYIEGNADVYVGNLPTFCDEDDVRTALEKFGTLSSLFTRIDKQFAFATYADPSAAKDAVYAAFSEGGVLVCERAVKIVSKKPSLAEAADKDQQAEEKARLREKAALEGREIYVGNLPYVAREDDVRRAFARFGNIVTFSPRIDAGYAFIEYDHPASAQRAVVAGEPPRPFMIGRRAALIRLRTLKPDTSKRVVRGRVVEGKARERVVKAGDQDDDDLTDVDPDQVFDEEDEHFRTVECPSAASPDRSLEVINKEITDLFDKLKVSPGDEARRTKLVARLQPLIESVIPRAELYLYGSSVNTYGMKNADVDLGLCLKSHPPSAALNKLMRELALLLRKNGCRDVQPLTRTRVPVLKFKDGPSQFKCDMCFNNRLAIENSRLLRAYGLLDERVRPLVYAVKQWAKHRGINEPYHGTLSSYAYVLLIIHYLQVCGILPSLQQLAEEKYGPAPPCPPPKDKIPTSVPEVAASGDDTGSPATKDGDDESGNQAGDQNAEAAAEEARPRIVSVDGSMRGRPRRPLGRLEIGSHVYIDGYNCTYLSDSEETVKEWLAKRDEACSEPKTVGELLAGFFQYYATQFNYRDNVVSIRCGKAIPKTENEWDVESIKGRTEGYLTEQANAIANAKAAAAAAKEAASEGSNNADSAATKDASAEETNDEAKKGEGNDGETTNATDEEKKEREREAKEKEEREKEEEEERARQYALKLRRMRDRHYFSIEDPFETTHDLGRVVDRKCYRDIRTEFIRGCKLLFSANPSFEALCAADA